MKPQNKYRTEKQNVQLLEKALSIKDRLFSLLAFKRGARRLRRWFLIALAAAPIIWGIYYSINYAVEKAYSLSIDHISYVSRHGLISRSQAMELLGIKDAVNMATLDVSGMEATLEANPCIAAATIRAEMPETLHIEIDERIPVVFVEMESGTDTGDRTRKFMDPKGTIFPVNEAYHRNFMNAPTWYLQPEDLTELKDGAVIEEERNRPIKELIAASNAYSLTEIPAICEIFRPKQWKMVITLENGTEVLMQVYDIKDQLARLSMILEHARVSKKAMRSINVIPKINPTVIYAEEADNQQNGKKQDTP
ncbi:MAG: FtsQ-type POTRA domain-containing protein [Akkermansia sp.]|nr:FtsQ-type POTRA domain-containing protein [Akkermansia sp.]